MRKFTSLEFRCRATKARPIVPAPMIVIFRGNNVDISTWMMMATTLLALLAGYLHKQENQNAIPSTINLQTLSLTFCSPKGCTTKIFL